MTATITRVAAPVDVAVLTVSDSRTLEQDRSGDTIVGRLTQAGHRLADRRLCKDDFHTIRETIAAWVADPKVDFVIVTGGTGVTQRDVTPDAVRSLFTKPIPGFGELFRWLSYAEIGTSTIQSRARCRGVWGHDCVSASRESRSLSARHGADHPASARPQSPTLQPGGAAAEGTT